MTGLTPTQEHPMPQERLDAIRARADIIRARVNAMTVNDSRWSYPVPDPTDERIKELEKENAELRKRLTVDEDMVERATHGIAAHWHDMHTNEALGRQRALARVALDAALNTGEEA